MNLNQFFNGKNIHFLGIGGVSMSALAKYLYNNGFTVDGSDLSANDFTQELVALNIPVQIGENTSLPRVVDTVVYTDAISSENVELKAAKNRGIPCLSRMELLNAIANNFERVITVAGSHGKTSTTAMCAHVLHAFQAKFTAFIGGRDKAFENYHSEGDEILLTEACEYKRNLSKFNQIDLAVWGNCDRDHLECYRDFEDLKTTFYSYARKAKKSIVNADDENVIVPENAVTFGIKNTASDYVAVSMRASGERYAFTVLEMGEKLCRIRLRVLGGFQVYNALAVVACMRALGVDVNSIVKGIENFTGVKRRFEKLGVWAGVTFFADYAHHPAEIEKVITLAKRRKHGKLLVIFQPHTYSRTKLLFDEFVASLSGLDNLVIYKTYPAREAYDEEASAYELHRNIQNSLYAEGARELETAIRKHLKSGDTALFLGAGDIYGIARQVLSKMNEKSVKKT